MRTTAGGTGEDRGAGELLLHLCLARLTCRCGDRPGTLLGTEGPAGTRGRLQQQGMGRAHGDGKADSPCSVLVRGRGPSAPLSNPGTRAIWAGAFARPHPLIPQASSPGPAPSPPLIPLCLLHSSCSWVNPRLIAQTIKIAGAEHPIPCQRSQICFLMSRTSVSCWVSSSQTSLGFRA